MNKDKKLWLLFIINILFTSSVLSYSYKKIDETNEKLNQKLEESNKEIKSLKDNLENIGNNLNRIQNSLFYSNSIVTNEIIANRIYFSDKQCKLEISPQTSMLFKFKGQGKIDMPDRDIKAMLLRLIEQIEPIYNAQKEANTDFIKWENYEIVITNYNYEIATYKNKKIILKGEKE